MQGTGQPCKLVAYIAGYKGEQLSEDRYELYKTANGWDPSEWTESDAKNATLSFPNLPYCIDSSTGVKISEFTAIVNYLASKGNLAGASVEEKAVIDQLISIAQECRSKYVQAVYGDFDSMKPELVQKILDKAKLINNFLQKSNGPYLLGNSINVADLVLFDLFEQFMELTPETFEQLDSIKAFVKAVRDRADVNAFLQSEYSITWPYNNHFAKFGARSDPPKRS